MSDTALPKHLLKDVNRLNPNDLHALHHYIMDRLKSIRQAKDFVALRKFTVLDSVVFEYHGEIIQGKIIRLNQKTATVITELGSRWNVSPHVLSKKAQETIQKNKPRLTDNRT